MTTPSNHSHLPQRPLLVGLYHKVRLETGKTLVTGAGRSVIFTEKQLGGRIPEFLDALDGTNDLDHLRQAFPELVPSLLEQLHALELIIEGYEAPKSALSPPSLTAFALGSRSAEEVQHRLSRAIIAVVGCGPVAGAAALLLSKAGAGRILFADSVPASWRDLSVSPILNPHHLGCRRDQATAAICSSATGAECKAVDNVLAIARIPTDLVLIEAGYDGKAEAAATWCRDTQRAYMVHRQDALSAIVGPTVPPGGSPCHRCAEDRRLSHVDHLPEHLAYLRHRASVAPESDGFLAAHSSLVAGIIADDALRVLLDAHPRTLGAAVIIDLSTFAVHREHILSIPGCQSCQVAPEART